MNAPGDLYESLDRRPRPEEIASEILGLLGDSLSPEERRLLERAARQAGPTSMSSDFARPVGLDRQVARARELLPELEAGDFELLVSQLGSAIAKEPGKSDFKADRLDGEARSKAGLEISRRRYNKLFRFAARFEEHLGTLRREQAKRRMTQLGKSRLATRLSREEFCADRDSACFIAYFAARCNLRSRFTIEGQVRPYDEIADMLLARCRRSGSASWWAIAHVLPDREVLEHLTAEEQGRLLAAWFDALRGVASFLRQTWDLNSFDRVTMIVRKGDDSTTWNNAASAWNKARQGWFALLQALGAERVIDGFCPGKALRLMAADVARWHRQMGGELQADTAVWNELPFPWEVLEGEVSCLRQRVESSCARHGVDPVKAGWTAAPAGLATQPFEPTPELVHGVTVSDPHLALLFRKAGVFR